MIIFVTMIAPMTISSYLPSMITKVPTVDTECVNLDWLCSSVLIMIDAIVSEVTIYDEVS